MFILDFPKSYLFNSPSGFTALWLWYKRLLLRKLLIIEVPSQECYAWLCRTDVRRLGWGCMPLIPFVLHYPHAQRGSGREGEEGGTEGIPMRPSLLLSTKCLLQQLQTQVCDVGKTCCWTSNHPKSPLDLHINKVEWSLYFSGTVDFFCPDLIWRF